MTTKKKTSLKVLRGAKQDPKPSKAELLQQVAVDLKNLQAASRINQLMIQQLLKSNQGLNADLGKAYGIISELQYKVLALQTVGNFDKDAVAKKSEEFRLTDFEDAAANADKEGNFTVGDVVKKDSTVILTSTTAGEDAGIFRSRIELATCGVPALIEGLEGKPVGTEVKCQLNGVEHTVKLLGIRNPPPAPVVPAPAPVAETVAPTTATVQ